MPLRNLSLRTVATAARGLLLIIAALLALVGDVKRPLAFALVLAGLALLAVVGTQRLPDPTLRLLIAVEAALWAAGVLLTGSDASPFLPYLLGPALAGGTALGVEGVLLPVGVAALGVLSVAPAVTERDRLSAVAAAGAEWGALGLVVGLLSAWVHHLRQRVPSDDGYLLAYRLLGQLRAVARRLPTGLDPAVMADNLLRELRSAVPQSVAGTIYSSSYGDQLTVLAHSGPELSSALPDLTADGPYAEAWTSQRPVSQPGQVVLPLIAGDRTNGLVVLTLEPGTGQVAMPELLEAAEVVREGALRLESALLFDEVRELATVEERRRLAREIHDGVAQDMAAFGYQLDGLAHDLRATPDAAAQVQEIRRDLGRLVGELRQSIFELRTDVGESPSFGAALADYARALGAGTGLNIHLSMDENGSRLGSDQEAELLRIAQEAINNSRRHAQAENLWVRCEIAPPFAVLVVEDDGIGLEGGRDDSFGLVIMRERAQRLRAELTIQPREPRGTVVRCVVGRRIA